MTFNWREYLALARALQQAGPGYSEEAASRSAISRAYYAAFCAARNHARDTMSFQPGYNPDDHGRLRAYFKRSRAATLAQSLERLREARNLCDYQDEIHAFDELLRDSLADADDVMDWIDQHS